MFLLLSTAAAFGLVAHVTGSWGAALWGGVFSAVSGLACLYDDLTARRAGGETA